MRVCTLFFLLMFCMFLASGQQQKPILRQEAIANEFQKARKPDAEYTLIIYGALGCSYSRYLIENLPTFDTCKNTEVMLILDNSLEEIRAHYSKELERFPIYSNHVLNHTFRKGNDITPQTFLYKREEQLQYFKGLKKKMFVKINEQIQCL